jgi:hypothetical protein
MYALARWGARTLGPPKHDDELYPEWGLNGLPALFNGEEARGLTETYVLKIEDDVFTARIVHGSLDASIDALEDADLVVETDGHVLRAGERRAGAAGRGCEGVTRAEGDPAAIDRCFRLLSIAPRVTAAA